MVGPNKRNFCQNIILFLAILDIRSSQFYIVIVVSWTHFFLIPKIFYSGITYFGKQIYAHTLHNLRYGN